MDIVRDVWKYIHETPRLSIMLIGEKDRKGNMLQKAGKDLEKWGGNYERMQW